MQISKDLGMSRNTITKILDESEIEHITQETKGILLNALPDSARTIAHKVKKNSTDAWELLDRTGVMPKNFGEQSTNIAVGLQFEGLPTLAKAQDSLAPQANQSDRPPEDSI